ncbi:MAG TPA: TetR/AcrR family transcriptional regulator [Micromonosporaceae bacterium]|nr:TetR/AcrR family transcriptional regulator [Micromonosporaceae bacterium]
MGAPTRRERLRTATITEIKEGARRLLVSGGGPQAISLRAIARDMGMTAPAIYRYFPSLDALVVELTDDLFDELRRTLEAARDATGDDPAQQLAEMARAFRRWSVAHPAEFALVFGTPLPGISTFDGDCRDTDHPASAFGALFMQSLLRLWQQAPWPTPPADLLRKRLGDTLHPLKQNQGEMPIEVAYTFLSGWVRLYGLVSMEVYDHLRWAVTDPQSLFEAEIGSLLQQLSAMPTPDTLPR